jgi:GNAT superfamily N-acetyltransferase
MPITFRPLLKQDCESVIALCSAVQPERVADTKVYLQRFDEPPLEASPFLRQWVAMSENDEPDAAQQCIGYAACWLHLRQKYRIDLMVRADWRGRGVGSGMLDRILASLQAIPAASLQARTWDDWPESLQFLQRGGFVEIHRMVELRLNLRDADLSPFAQLPVRLMAQGVQFTTWWHQAEDEQFWAKLTDLQQAAAEGWPDPDPDGEITRATEDQVRRMFASWRTRPEELFLAKVGEEYIGYTALGPDPGTPEVVGTGPTAVRPAHRGRGLATALKFLSLHHARRTGWQAAITRSANPAMIRVNEKFGFRRGRAEVRLVRRNEQNQAAEN